MGDTIRAAYERADLDAFGKLLADDVTWGENHPNQCTGRADVLKTFSSWVGAGVTATVTTLDIGPGGVACKLHVAWVDPNDKPVGRTSGMCCWFVTG
jgi:ketosteroid isomerase-like protein